MSELTRRRAARDIWISRGHLWAAGVAMVLIGLGGFVAGWWAAGSRSPAVAPAQVATSDEALIDLLARVDARVVSHDGVDALTFPDALTGIGEPTTVPDAEPADLTITQVAGGSGEGSRDVRLVVLAEPAQISAITAALADGDWELAEHPDGLVVHTAPGAEQAQAARDRVIERLAAAGLQPEITLQAVEPDAR